MGVVSVRGMFSDRLSISQHVAGGGEKAEAGRRMPRQSNSTQDTTESTQQGATATQDRRREKTKNKNRRKKGRDSGKVEAKQAGAVVGEQHSMRLTKAALEAGATNGRGG